jgi:hypothetical protein
VYVVAPTAEIAKSRFLESVSADSKKESLGSTWPNVIWLQKKAIMKNKKDNRGI